MNKKQPAKGFSRLIAASLILSAIARFSDFLRDRFSEGFFGHLLTGERDSEAKGLFAFLSEKIAFRRRVTIPLKRFFAGSVDKSMLLTKVKSLFAMAPNVQIKCFGIYYFSVGLCFSVGYLIRKFALGLDVSLTLLVLGILSALLGGILTASQKQCGEAIRQSRILSLLLFDAMGMKRDSLSSDGPPIGRGDVAFLIGIAAGCIGMLTSPPAILCVVPFLFLGYGILRQPESGVILLLLAVPFFGTATIGSFALFVTACWLLKVIRGKRILATNALDVSVLAFAFVVLAGGMVSVTGMESLRAAAIFLVMLSGYFIAVNLIRTSEWIVRCRRALLFALAVTATIGVVEYLLGFAPQKWLDPTMLSIIPGRCVSVFANPNVLAAALLLLLPFAMTARSLSPSGDRRLEWTVLLFVTFLCLVFTWSRGGWIGAACVVLVMALLLSRHLLARIFCILLLLPAALVCLPDSILQRILSAFHMTDTSVAYRIGIWRGTESLLSECFAGGIGMGEEAFRRVYPLYSLSTVETAPHTHNLYTQIMVSVGFTGFALFAALLLVFLRHVAAYSRTGKSDPAVLRYTASAGFSAIVGFLLMGMTDYVWYNSRVVLLFWMVLGLTSAAIRVGESERIEARLDGPHLEFDYKRRTAATSGRKDR